MPGTFRSVSSLNYLDLSQNKLQVISSRSFTGLRQLKLLNLSRNKITGENNIWKLPFSWLITDNDCLHKFLSLKYYNNYQEI